MGPIKTGQKKRKSRVVDVDRHVGAKIRERRIAIGVTQQELADLIGVTYQQAHKYERGINRISAGRLFAIAVALDVPVTSFFEGLPPTGTDELTDGQRLSLDIGRLFSRIENEKHREALATLTKVLSEA